MSKRVVVTGLGLVTPVGLNVHSNWQNLLAGKSNFKKLSGKEYESIPCKVAAEVDKEQLTDELLKENVLKKSDFKTMSMANVFAIASAHQAIKDSGWRGETESEQIRAGLSIATGMAGLIEISEVAAAMSKDSHKSYKSISPYFVPKILANLSSGLVSIKYKLKGPNHSITTACAAGSHAISDGISMIKNNLADVMLCGATEACIHPVSIGGFCRMRALATRFNESPTSASRPFDLDRDGFVMSEGSGCLVLESLEHATQRGAKIYGELLGYGLNGDAGHITNPNGEGALRCMQMALNQSGVELDDVNYINMHATSTPVGDVAEITAIKRLYANNQASGGGESSTPVYISSVKGSLGHLLGAAGAVETILTLLACKDRIIPPSINVAKLDPELKLEESVKPLKLVVNEKLELNSSGRRFVALKNSFGFGGTNACICVSSFDN